VCVQPRAVLLAFLSVVSSISRTLYVQLLIPACLLAPSHAASRALAAALWYLTPVRIIYRRERGRGRAVGRGRARARALGVVSGVVDTPHYRRVHRLSPARRTREAYDQAGVRTFASPGLAPPENYGRGHLPVGYGYGLVLEHTVRVKV